MDVQARLADAPTLRGEFEQTRTLKGFNNPLVSRGDFLLARPRTLLWRTSQPFAFTLLVTRARLLSRGADGTTNAEIDTRTEPGLRVISNLIFALVAGDLRKLARHFRIDGELLDAHAWRLVLTPIDAPLAEQFVKLGLDGDRYVREVRLEERGGDRTLIRFDALRASPKLTREEAARLESAGS